MHAALPDQPPDPVANLRGARCANMHMRAGILYPDVATIMLLRKCTEAALL
jgi:hypothetical protein